MTLQQLLEHFKSLGCLLFHSLSSHFCSTTRHSATLCCCCCCLALLFDRCGHESALYSKLPHI